MENNQLDPSVEKFKQFVKGNPKIIDAVRREKLTWQELYEDWYLLGEDDPRWGEFNDNREGSFGSKRKSNQQEEESNGEDQKKDWVGQIIGAVKKMDTHQIEAQINHLSQAISAIQGVLSQFHNENQTNNVHQPNQPLHPFTFRKD